MVEQTISRMLTLAAFAAGLVVGSLSLAFTAETSALRGTKVSLNIDSGVLEHRGNDGLVVFSDIVHQPGANWLRLFFRGSRLSEGSFLRLTALHDGEQQILDRRALADWRHSSAYFNGSTVIVELVAAPESSNRLSIFELIWDHSNRDPIDTCGYCETDDRLPFPSLAVCRLMGGSYSCSGTIISESSHLVTAGHCLSAGSALIAQFNVPNSNADCSMNMPPVNDQFPIVGWICEVAGPGNDWAAVLVGQNGVGQRPFDRYGTTMVVADTIPTEQNGVTVLGYGDDQDQCELADTLQASIGKLLSVDDLMLTFNADVTYGSSGSPVLKGGTNKVFGITTHCPCPNVATRIDHPNFVAARDLLFNGAIGDTCDTAVFASEGENVFSTTGALDSDFPDPDASQCPDSYLDWDAVNSPDTWMVWQPPASGSLTLTTCDSTSFDTSLVVYRGGTCNSLEQVACNGDATTADESCQNFYSAIADLTVSGLSTYYIRIGGWQGASGTGILGVNHTPAAATGACCFAGSCFNTLESECTDVGGLHQGVGSTCGSNPCGIPTTGACCSIDGTSCNILSEADCSLQDGTFLEANVDCQGNPCGIPIPCPPDFNSNGRVDVDDLLALLSNFGQVNETVDLDANGIINVDDLLLLISRFGPCPTE